MMNLCPADKRYLAVACPLRSCAAPRGRPCCVNVSPNTMHQARAKEWNASLQRTPAQLLRRERAAKAGAHEWTSGVYSLMPACPVKACNASAGSRCHSGRMLGNPVISLTNVHTARMVRYMETPLGKRVQMVDAPGGVILRKHVDSLSGPGHISRATERKLDRDVPPEIPLPAAALRGNPAWHLKCPLCGGQGFGKTMSANTVGIVCSRKACRMTIEEPTMTSTFVPKRLMPLFNRSWEEFEAKVKAEAIERAWVRWDRRA